MNDRNRISLDKLILPEKVGNLHVRHGVPAVWEIFVDELFDNRAGIADFFTTGLGVKKAL